MAGQLRAVCCVALGGSGRASGHLVTTPGSSGAVRCGSLGRLWPRGWTGTRSQLRAVLEDGQTGRKRAEQKAAGPNAWQGPDGSGAARCGSLGGSGRANGRTPGPAPGGQEDGQACHRRAW